MPLKKANRPMREKPCLGKNSVFLKIVYLVYVYFIFKSK